MAQVLNQLPKPEHPDLLVGMNTLDDAGVFKLSDELALVQTVDFFTPIVDDPYTFGAIAAANSLSDIYAMGGEPVTALNIVGFPKSQMDAKVLVEILKGGHDKATEAGCVIVGGHTVEDKELKYGLAVTGKIAPSKILTTRGAQAGDTLILTKPLGTGIVTTAFKLDSIPNELYRSVTQSMLTLNQHAASLAVKYGAHACTDITGFGLLGHAWNLARESAVGLVFYAAAIPIFAGVEKLAARKFLTMGDVSNREYLQKHLEFDEQISEEKMCVLFDPQTSGGLLISLNSEIADEFVAALHAGGTIAAQIVGRATKENPGKLIVVNH